MVYNVTELIESQVLTSLNTLFFHHTHTADSNRFEREVRDLNINAHATDYVEIMRRLPDGVDGIFTKTDHWKTNPEYFFQLEKRLQRNDIDFERFDTHLVFRIDGSTGVIINGVEASFESEKEHFTIIGLPISDNNLYYNLTLKELVEAGTKADWLSFAHMGMPFHRISEETLRDVIYKAEQKDVDVAIGYATGYSPLYNRITRNEIPFRTPVREYAREYNLPVVPELDLHCVVPPGFTGCGVTDSEATRVLTEGKLPTQKLLAADLFIPSQYREGISVVELLRTYAVFLPGIPQRGNSEQTFRHSLPQRGQLQSINIRSSVQTLSTNTQNRVSTTR